VTVGNRPSPPLSYCLDLERINIPPDVDSYELKCGSREITLTNLRKVFWPELGKTKRDLLDYYAAVAGVLLPHIKDRAMVMKRYPNGISGKFFFMKRTPEYRPDWLETCSIEHASGSIIDFPIAQDIASLLWIVNLGCIDLNPWYSRCDDVNRPDVLHFDLDPVPPAGFSEVKQAALTNTSSVAYRRRRDRVEFISMCLSCAGRFRNKSGRSRNAWRSRWISSIPRY
jgi:hypothetical protein